MYNIGDLYDNNGVKGVIISLDYTGIHGLVMSLDEAFLNWHEANQWCKKLGEGWHMPSLTDMAVFKYTNNVMKIQETLIFNGMPLCLGDKSIEGTHHNGHMYWTNDFHSHSADLDWMHVYCFNNEDFSSISKDYKESCYEYIRAVHEF